MRRINRDSLFIEDAKPAIKLVNTSAVSGQCVKVDLGGGAMMAFVEVPPSSRGEVASVWSLRFDQVLETIHTISSKLNDTLHQVRPSRASIHLWP